MSDYLQVTLSIIAAIAGLSTPAADSLPANLLGSLSRPFAEIHHRRSSPVKPPLSHSVAVSLPAAWLPEPQGLAYLKDQETQASREC